MPRPQRSKVAPSAPDFRVRKPAKPTAETAPDHAAPERLFNDMYDVSDPEEGVVTSARRVKKDNGKGKAVMVRGQGNATIVNTRGLRSENSFSELGNVVPENGHVSSQGQSRGVEIADFDLESSSPAVEVGRRERGTPLIENSLLALGNFQRRPRQPSILGRAAARARSSSIESNSAQDSGLTSVGKRNSSVLGRSHSRQPSITGRNTRRAKSSSIAQDRGTPANIGSTFNLGNFKRRARQPSILGTAQKERQTRLEYDDEDDFSPEDESTPLNLSKTRDLASSSSASNPRKRKLSAVQVPRSSPPLASNREMETEDAILSTAPPLVGANDDDDASQSSGDVPLPSIEHEVNNAEAMSETMAPPASSSPTPESPPSYRAAQRLRAEMEAPRGRRRLRDRTPPPIDQDSPISSPPSLTHSPNYPVAKAAPKSKHGKQAPPRSTFSTAQLQALLPRRRRRGPRDPFDIGSSEDEIDVSGLASDDDELTHSSIRAAPSRRSVIPRIPPSGRAPRKSKAAPKLGSNQTYGQRPTTSDKENEEVDPDDSLAPLPDDGERSGIPENSQELEKRLGKELKKAARKFEEIDKWELEFEECTASSSSPKDSR